MPGSSRVPAPVPVPCRRPPTRAAAADKMAQDRRAGRRDALAPDAVVAPGEALQQPRRGRRRHRQQAVARAHQAVAARQGGDAPARAVERRGDAARRRPRPSANPSRRSRGNARRPPARRGSRLRPPRGWRRMAIACAAVPGTERRGLDARHHVAEAGVSVMVVMVGSLAVMPQPARSAGSAGRRWCRLVKTGVPAAGRQHGRDVRQHAAAQIRQGIEHRGDEHVARDAADRIEMDVRRAHAAGDRPARRRGLRG